MGSPKISIITCLYNTEPEHFQKCILSMVNQTFKDWECIIFNDGSDKYIEENIKFIASFNDQRFRIFKKDHNGKIANLYKKNEDSSYKFVNNVRLTDDGVANNLDVNTAGDYTIMLSDLSDKLGDVNSDLYINANDALGILKHSVGLNININCAVADLNNDNYINAKDSLIVLKTSLGLM